MAEVLKDRVFYSSVGAMFCAAMWVNGVSVLVSIPVFFLLLVIAVRPINGQARLNMNNHYPKQTFRHFRARVGNETRLRSWDRRMVPDESGRLWLAYRLVDKTCGHTAVQVDRFDTAMDRRVIAFFVKSMRGNLRMLVAEGPPQDQEKIP